MIAIDEMLQQPVPQAIGWALLQFVWQGALIAALTAALLALLRRSAADVRYVVATIALSLMLTMPVVTAIQSLRGDAGSAAPIATVAQVEQPAGSSAAEPKVLSELPVSALTSSMPVQPAAEPIERWLPLFVAAWLAGVALLTLRLLSGWMWVQRMKSRGSIVAGDAIQQIATRLSRRLHITRTVGFLQSTAVDVPTVIGWIKPVVLLPASVLAGLTPQQLEAILAHELAHIRRHDYLVNLLQTVVETLLFYHPAVWWLSRRIRMERENCCDDLAVSLCGDPVAYASALAELEGLRAEHGHLVLAASGGSLLQRVRRLLGAPSHAGRAPGWLAAGAALVLIVGICIGAIGHDRLGAQALAAAVDHSDDQFPAVPPDPPDPPLPPEPPELPDPAEPADPPEPPQPSLPPEPPLPPEPVAADLESLDARLRAMHDAMRVLLEGQTRPTVTACVERLRARHVKSTGAPASRAVVRMFRDACDGAAVTLANTPDADKLARDFLAFREAEARAVEAAHAATPAIAASALEDARLAIESAKALAPASTAPAFETPLLAAMGADMDRAISETRGAVAAQTAKASSATNETVHSSDRDGQKTGNYIWSDDGHKLEVNYRGEFEFTDDDMDVRSMTPGGWLRIRETRRGASDYRVEFSADASGKIQRRFWTASTEGPFETTGRAWLKEILPRFIRQSGIGAEGRVARIYKSKGADGVLAEISAIEGSWTKRLYFTHLLKMPSLGPRVVQQALAQAGREVDSDYELASLLISAEPLVRDEATRRAYFDAARTIDSDYEMRRVFSSALKSGPIAAALLVGMLEASASIGNDYELASLLEQVARQQPIETSSRAAFFRALATVGNAYEQRRVLSMVMRRAELDTESAVLALEQVSAMKSDYEAATVLLEYLKENRVEGAVRTPFFRAVGGIGSPYERGRVLQAVARRSDASNETVLDVIRAAEGIKNGYEKAQVLLAVAGSHQLTGDGRDAYIDASKNLSDHEQGRVLSALARTERR